MKPTRSRLLATATAAVVAAGATTALAALPGTADAAGAAHSRTVHVRISADRVVHAPHLLRPGVHRFVVSSAKRSSFQVFRTKRGYTDRELARDVDAGLNNESAPDLRALKRFERNVTLIGGVSSAKGHPGTVLMNLPRGGRYGVVDTNTRDTRASRIRHFRVRGARLAGTMPRVPTIRAINETEWAGRPASIPRRGLLGFANASTDNHFVAMARLLPGKTIADFKAWVDAIVAGTDPGAPPIDESAPGLDSAVVSPHHRMAWRYHLPTGDYVLTCFWPDADMGGMPHAFMGMYRGITVK